MVKEKEKWPEIMNGYGCLPMKNIWRKEIYLKKD